MEPDDPFPYYAQKLRDSLIAIGISLEIWQFKPQS
jgi:hypothetical protein